jgi:hypothetical protein|tara:strand:- start:247 stop:576 length:330 start_codon:yes stop_codon:yes gene_type:complete
MSVIEKAIQHFSSKERREIHVPEWDVTLFTRNLTLENKGNWLKRADGDSTEYMVYAVIYGLEDEEGNPAFDVGDKLQLKNHVDPDVVTRLATFVLETSGATEEDREKNL